MANSFLEALGFVSDVLDTPGSVVRGLASGNPVRAFGGVFDPSQRVSGRNLLEELGVVDRKPEGGGFDFGDIGGLAASVATDPLMLLPLMGWGAKAGLSARGAAKAAMAAKAVAPVAETARTVEAVAPVAKAVEALAPARMAETVSPIVKILPDMAPAAKAADYCHHCPGNKLQRMSGGGHTTGGRRRP